MDNLILQGVDSVDLNSPPFVHDILYKDCVIPGPNQPPRNRTQSGFFQKGGGGISQDSGYRVYGGELGV